LSSTKRFVPQGEHAMILTKLIVAAAALSFVAIGAADAAGKPKPRKIMRADGVVAYLPAPVVGTARPPWAAPWECYTDEGYGRFRSCSAGRR
jgi:hypothetical protein